MMAGFSNKNLFWIWLLATAILLSIASVYAQVDHLGLHFLKVQQVKVHEQMMEGTAGNPWQYRILADLMIDPLIKLFNKANIPGSDVSAFIVFRFFQEVLIFLTAGIYYKRLGLHFYANFIGLSLLAWGMSYSLYNSDLSFNVYFDVVFYLVAAILILDNKFIWILPLTALSAFNRETGVLIPFMLLGFLYFGNAQKEVIKPAAYYAIGSLIVFVIVFLGLRFYYGDQKFLTADGYYPGLGLLYINIRRWITWEQLLVTLSVIPFLAIFAYGNWPKTLKIFFWVIVPAWFGVHFLAALIAETRLLLVPQALIFIPGALFGLPIVESPKSAQGN